MSVVRVLLLQPEHFDVINNPVYIVVWPTSDDVDFSFLLMKGFGMLRTKEQIAEENAEFFRRALVAGLLGGSIGDFVMESMRARAAQERLFTREDFGSILYVDGTSLCADGGFVTDLHASFREAAKKVPDSISGYLNSRMMLLLGGAEQLRLEMHIVKYWGNDSRTLEIDPLNIPAHMPLGRRATLTVKEA